MKFKELRKERKLTQADIARIFNIEQKTYSNYETGKTQPDISFMKDFANYFYVSLDQLCDNTKKENEIPKNKIKAIDNIMKLNDKNTELVYIYSKALLDSQEK